MLRLCDGAKDRDSRLQELILRNSTFYDFRESIPASSLFQNIHTIDITDADIYLSKTSFERMNFLDHILKQKGENKNCKIKNIVTDQLPSYEYKYFGVNISRGASERLTRLSVTCVPDDMNYLDNLDDLTEHEDQERPSCLSTSLNWLR